MDSSSEARITSEEEPTARALPPELCPSPEALAAPSPPPKALVPSPFSEPLALGPIPPPEGPAAARGRVTDLAPAPAGHVKRPMNAFMVSQFLDTQHRSSLSQFVTHNKQTND
jgi:hypothetical protein